MGVGAHQVLATHPGELRTSFLAAYRHAPTMCWATHRQTRRTASLRGLAQHEPRSLITDCGATILDLATSPCVSQPAERQVEDSWIYPISIAMGMCSISWGAGNSIGHESYRNYRTIGPMAHVDRCIGVLRATGNVAGRSGLIPIPRVCSPLWHDVDRHPRRPAPRCLPHTWYTSPGDAAARAAARSGRWTCVASCASRPRTMPTITGSSVWRLYGSAWR